MEWSEPVLWTRLRLDAFLGPLVPTPYAELSTPTEGQESPWLSLTKMRQVITRDNHQLARLGIPDELVG